MYKVGQRVRVLNIESTGVQHFNHDDKDRLLNKIFKIVDDLGPTGTGRIFKLDTPFGTYNFFDYQFRALKKKSEKEPAYKVANVKKLSLKDEVDWLNKVKSNFKDAGRIIDPDDDRPRGGMGLMRDIFTTPQPVRTARYTGTIQGLGGVAIPRPVDPGFGLDEMQEAIEETDEETERG